MFKGLQVACLNGKCIKRHQNATNNCSEFYEKTSKLHARTSVAKIKRWRHEWKKKGTKIHQNSIKSNREKRQENRHLGGEAKGGKRRLKQETQEKTALFY